MRSNYSDTFPPYNFGTKSLLPIACDTCSNGLYQCYKVVSFFIENKEWDGDNRADLPCVPILCATNLEYIPWFCIRFILYAMPASSIYCENRFEIPQNWLLSTPGFVFLTLWYGSQTSRNYIDFSSLMCSTEVLWFDIFLQQSTSAEPAIPPIQ